MKLNRKWLLAIALVLSLTMAISGTLAYLTDRDTVENVFTMGNVDIEVEEEFDQNSPLYPGVEVDKEAGITNTHATEDAYVWMVVSVPNNLAQYIELGWADGYSATEVNSPHEGYTGYLVKYPEVLNAGSSTGNILESVKLASNVDYQNGQYVAVSGGQTTEIGNLSDVKIMVDGFAIQTEGFDGVDAAYNAYTTQWSGLTGGESGVDNEDPSFTPYTEVATFDQLKAALEKGGTIKLKDDIEFINALEIKDGAKVKLDMAGKKITLVQDYESETPLFDLKQADTKLTITGNGTFDFGDNMDAALVFPRGDVVIENGNFIRNRIPEGTDPKEVQELFVGIKNSTATVVIKDGYFDSGYYDANAETFFETDADVGTRGKYNDKNLYRTAIRNNIMKMLNESDNDIIIYGGTFVGANPAWGDEGCALPITPEYLRPWSYYQGPFLDGQQITDGDMGIPAAYTITEGRHADGRPTYTVTYSK